MIQAFTTKVIDPQVNGGFISLPSGEKRIVDFSSPNLKADETLALADSYAQRGIFLLPTIITADVDIMARNSNLIVETIGSHSVFAGLHLEGPFLSAKSIGAHPAQHLRAANINDFKRIFKAAKEQVVLTTLAPEIDGALDLIKAIADLGVVVSIGHHAASIEQLKAGFASGASALTHAGNAWNHDDFNKKSTDVYDVLREQGIFVMLIPDARHVPPRFVRMCEEITRLINPAKGYQRFVITSDASPLEGAPEGRYRVFLGDEAEVLADPKNGLKQILPLKGSWLDLRKCMQVLAGMEVDGAKIIEPASIQAAASLNTLNMLKVPFSRLRLFEKIEQEI